MPRGVGQGKGFQPVQTENLIIRQYKLGTAYGCSAGDALVVSGTAGYLKAAASGATQIFAVASETVTSISTAGSEPNVLCFSLENAPVFRVECNAAATASNMLLAASLIDANTVRQTNTAATAGVFRILAADNMATAVIGKFCKTPFVNDRV